MKRLIIYSIISLIFISNTLGQSRVSGYVYDEFTNDPIENVAIFDNYSNKIFLQRPAITPQASETGRW